MIKNFQFKYILFSISLILTFAHCAKSTTDNSANPAPVNNYTTCDAGKIKNARGDCESCPSGQVVSNNTCITPTTVPDAPTGLTATVVYDNLQLNWAQTNGATEFLLYWSTSSANFNIASASLLKTSSYTIVHQSLLTGITYYYKLYAKNSIGTSTNFASTSGIPYKTMLTTCGNTIGINGPSVVIYKWITTGAGPDLTYSDENVVLPNSRILATFVKGCDGGAAGSVQQELTNVRSASLYYRNFSPNFIPVSNVLSIDQVPALALSTSRAPAFSSNEIYFTMELRNGSNAIVAQIGLLQSLNITGLPYFGGCFTNTQYVSINLSLSFYTVAGAKTFVTPDKTTDIALTCLDFATPSSVSEAAFPNVGRVEMNKLLQAAGKGYTIPLK